MFRRDALDDAPCRAYNTPMLALVTRSLLIVAVLLMPFGMASAASSAARQIPTGMAMQHCPDNDAADHGLKAGIAACTMACAGALPATDLARRYHSLPVAEGQTAVIARHMPGLHPETLTPPPKAS